MLPAACVWSYTPRADYSSSCCRVAILGLFSTLTVLTRGVSRPQSPVITAEMCTPPMKDPLPYSKPNGSAATPPTTTTTRTTAGEPSYDLEANFQDQVKVVSLLLEEGEKVVGAERRRPTVARVQERYQKGVSFLARTHNHSPTSVQESAVLLQDKLQANLASAHLIWEPLQDLATQPGSHNQTADSSLTSTPPDPCSSLGSSPLPPVFCDSLPRDTRQVDPSVQGFMGNFTAIGGWGCGWAGRGGGDGEGGKLRALLEGMQVDNDRLRMEMERLKRQMKSLQIEQTNMKTQFTNLCTVQAGVTTRMTTLQSHQVNMSRQMESLQADMEIQLGCLCTKATTATSDLIKIQGELTALQTRADQNQTSQAETDRLIREMQTRMEGLNTPVHFHAQLSRNTTLSKCELVKLDRVVSSSGKVYDPKTGIFTAPRSGTYLFLASSRVIGLNFMRGVEKSDNKFSMFSLIANKEKVAGSRSMGPSTSCTAHAVIVLKAGDTVCMGTGGLGTYHFSGDGSTSFTGALLHPDNN